MLSPLELNCVDKGEQSSHRRSRKVSPSSRALLTRANAEVVVTGVEGEPLESSSVDEGKGRSSCRRSRRQTPQDELCR